MGRRSHEGRNERVQLLAIDFGLLVQRYLLRLAPHVREIVVHVFVRLLLRQLFLSLHSVEGNFLKNRLADELLIRR